MSNAILRACPFCGGDGLLYTTVNSFGEAEHQVVCPGCGGSAQRYRDRGKAVSAWNLRLPPVADDSLTQGGE